MWTEFLTVLTVVMGVAIYYCVMKIRSLEKRNGQGLDVVMSAELALDSGRTYINTLEAGLKSAREELENVRTQSTALWQENVRLREVQLIASDRGMMTMVEEFIENRDEQNRQTMAALGYQSMHKNDLDNPFGIGPISPYMTGKGLDKAPPSLPAAPIEAERSGAEPLLLEARDVQADFIELLSEGKSGAEPKPCTCPLGFGVNEMSHINTCALYKGLCNCPPTHKWPGHQKGCPYFFVS